MSVLDGVKSITTALSQALTAITDEIACRRKRIEDLRRALQELRDRPLPVDEIEARAAWYVRALSDQYRREQRDVILVSKLGDPKDPRHPVTFNEPVTWGQLAAGRPDLALELLMVPVRQASYAAGPPAAERPALIARCEHEIAEAQTADEAAVDAACEAGLTIAHQPDVVARRATEALQREREAVGTEDHRRRQVAVDAAYGPARAPLHDARRPGSGESEYLAANRLHRIL